MKSLMVRLLMLLTVAMLLAIPGPAMAADFDNDFDSIFGSGLDRNDIGDDDLDGFDGLFGNNFRTNDFDDEDCDDDGFGILSDNDEDCDFDDDGEDLRVIEVGDEECLVEEDEDDDDVEVLFCDEEDDGNDAQATLDAFFAQNAEERGF